MRTKLYSFVLILVASFGLSFTSGTDPLEIGESSAAFAELTTNLKGEDKVLREYLKPNGIVLVFSCNTCPFVLAWEDRYPDLAAYCDANNIAFVLVNSNEAKRDGDDSFVAMKNHATEKNYSFPYVMDHNSTIANMLGAKTTPHVYFFDYDMKLVYRGAIDDNHKDADEVNKPYLLNALKSYVAGVDPNPNTTDALGCSIKRVKK